MPPPLDLVGLPWVPVSVVRLSRALLCPSDHIFEANTATQSRCPACCSGNVVPLVRLLERERGSEHAKSTR